MPVPLHERRAILASISGREFNEGEDVERFLLDIRENASTFRIEYNEDLERIVREWFQLDNNPRVNSYESYLGLADWSVQSITEDDVEIARVLRVPDNLDALGRVPTYGQHVLLAAFMFCDSVKFVNLRIGPRQVIVHWLASSTRSSESEAVIVGAAGGLTRSSSTYQVATVRGTRLDISVSVSAKKLDELRFLSESYRLIALAGEVRWQFLGMYRAFENAWLRIIYAELIKSFMANPEQAMQDAQRSIASEREQFEESVTLVDVKEEFKDFRKVFNDLCKEGNRFCNAIKRRVNPEKSTNNANDEWRIGVRACYQIRCSIVHSASQGPYYESYEDADAALMSLLVPLELAMQKLIGIYVRFD